MAVKLSFKLSCNSFARAAKNEQTDTSLRLNKFQHYQINLVITLSVSPWDISCNDERSRGTLKDTAVEGEKQKCANT